MKHTNPSKLWGEVCVRYFLMGEDSMNPQSVPQMDSGSQADEELTAHTLGEKTQWQLWNQHLRFSPFHLQCLAVLPWVKNDPYLSILNLWFFKLLWLKGMEMQEGWNDTLCVGRGISGSIRSVLCPTQLLNHYNMGSLDPVEKLGIERHSLMSTLSRLFKYAIPLRTLCAWTYRTMLWTQWNEKEINTDKWKVDPFLEVSVI